MSMEQHKQQPHVVPATSELALSMPEPPLKKSKSSGNSGTAQGPRLQGFAARLAASEPYRMFQTKSFSVAGTHKDPLGCVLPDLLHHSLGTLLETAQFSFVVDVDFVYETYKSQGAADKPLLLLYGELEGDTKQFTKGEFVKVSMPFLYGTHHSKLMLLRCVEGLRVVVHTANLRPDDWYEKTQGLWISPLFPKLDIKCPGSSAPGAPPSGDCPSLFRQDLLRYLHSYKLPQLAHWGTVIRGHDFSQCNAVFVGHAPGYHAGPELYSWGHLKLRRALGRHSNGGKWRPQGSSATGRTIVQCSSIGSLGKDSSSWLCSELGRSLSGGMDCPSKQMVVIYPSEEDIRTSSQGWGGGSCLPYNSNTHAKQTWLIEHLHNWRSSLHGRTAAMPHIKSYTRVTSSNSEAQYLLLTSANLSKAAWGQLQKQGGQLFIRSYEAGVLLLPHFVNGGDTFSLSKAAPHPLTLPYDLPPTPYPPGSRPWFMDTKKRDQDINGDTYP